MPADLRTVTAASALLWLQGRIDDADLVPGDEVIHWHELPDLPSYRAALGHILKLHRRGMNWLILRACHPVVWRKLVKEGGLVSLVEPRFYGGQEVQAARIVVQPHRFDAWCRRLKVNEDSTLQL